MNNYTAASTCIECVKVTQVDSHWIDPVTWLTHCSLIAPGGGGVFSVDWID